MTISCNTLLVAVVMAVGLLMEINSPSIPQVYFNCIFATFRGSISRQPLSAGGDSTIAFFPPPADTPPSPPQANRATPAVISVPAILAGDTAAGFLCLI